MTLESENSVSKLHEDVLVEVFEYLINEESDNNSETSDILNATLVCKRWNKIISESARLMNKIVLNLDQSINQSEVVSEDFNLTRHYRRVIMRNKLHPSKSIVNKVTNAIENYLTTLNLEGQEISAETIRRLSNCKHLQTVEFISCVWDKLKTPEINNEDAQIKHFEFKRLRTLRLDQHSTLRILSFIKCKQLENFEASLSMCFIINAESINTVNCLINFLNQLEECNNIKMVFRSWNFDTQLAPKFRWSKMNLTCEMNDDTVNANAITSIAALCKASQVNAVSEIMIRRCTKKCERLWEPILNSCKGIKTLSVTDCSSLSRRFTELRILGEVKTLVVNSSMFGCENFAYFTTKLPNVNKVFFHMPLRFITVTNTDILQPFFDQITELSLHLNFVNSRALPSRGDFCDIHFANLQSITFFNGGAFMFREIDEPFRRFCLQNQSLHHLNHEVCDLNPPLNNHLRWFNIFNGTNIKTCNVVIEKILKKNIRTPLCSAYCCLNWRESETTEEVLFGRSLTEEENRFFI